ncbi:SDR family oxidoreductase [Nocardiopsis exhalans]|uniref:NAD(P)-dependent dehydrogenase (Short-subunit alcohol dehydrogenase family) n=3 Tax=Nocardiopsis TaxID=2013 RepID=A0A840WDC9_9ACTN|nr:MULTISPECIES: SDR family oxidoreductase [Nocardiopsis]MBB5493413.1 NAD(P)-dependent dehydrogenase (short-subunit alcohol dehydrogenase family) [Nocardiopsis metallicus]MEE2051626.1 SDR family oxidoreductase [Nocardiopsis umidischolae]USY19865.1 SDR family oxidoreductase [Nocardiopsis exhalans]
MNRRTVLRVVTGAAGQIGGSLTTHLRARGPVLAVDRRPAPGVVEVDVASEEFAMLLRERLTPMTGRVELFHTAAHLGPRIPIAHTSPAAFSALVHDNLTAAYVALRALVMVLEERDLKASAVVLSSVGATRAHRYQPAYDAAKAGVESLVRSFTLEHGARLCPRAVAVGPLAESASTAADGERADDLIALVPRGTYMHLAELVEALDAFASPAFDGACGHTLTLDGGLSSQLRPAAIERPPDRSAKTPAPSAANSE